MAIVIVVEAARLQKCRVPILNLAAKAIGNLKGRNALLLIMILNLRLLAVELEMRGIFQIIMKHKILSWNAKWLKEGDKCLRVRSTVSRCPGEGFLDFALIISRFSLIVVTFIGEFKFENMLLKF
jgi:hypothetical protein